MVIRSKKELSFYLKADRMMNRGVFVFSLKDRIKNMFLPDDIISYLSYMRKVSYYKYKGNKVLYIWYLRKYILKGRKLGFSIGEDSLGYGAVLPHIGTIIVGDSPRIGNYAVLHTSTCISNNKKVIGDGLYLSTGSIITSEIVLGNNIMVGANSLVNKSYTDDNALIAGMPARFIKEKEPWYMCDSGKFTMRYEKVENLKKEMQLSSLY